VVAFTTDHLYRYRRLKSVSAITKIVQNNEGDLPVKILKSKRSIMTQQTSLIILCIYSIDSSKPIIKCA
jgi:hypothetical protein